MATMLALVQQAVGEMGLTVPSYVAGNPDTTVVQYLALINAAGYELAEKYQWEQLNIAYRFTTQYVTTTGNITDGSAVVTNIPDTSSITAGTYMATGTGINSDVYVDSVDSSTQVTLSQACTETEVGSTIYFSQTKYSLPSDYARPMNKTQWDKSKHWEMLGPVTAQQWEFLKSGYISTGPRLSYRLMGGYFQIWPPTTTNEYLGFEYISSKWALSTLGVTKSSFTVDTDTCIFPDRLMVLALKLKYFEVKGFDTTAFARDFTEHLSIALAANSGSMTLSFCPRIDTILIGPDQIPDQGYGQS